MVINYAKELAEKNNIESEPMERRQRKVSRRLDSGRNEIILSVIDEIKREMSEVVVVVVVEFTLVTSILSGVTRTVAYEF